MRTTDPAARAIQRGNMIAMGLYAAAAVMMSPRFQSWPPEVAIVAGDASTETFVGRTMTAHPGFIWIAIPLALLVTNTLTIAVGDRGNLFRPIARAAMIPPGVRALRARTLAWLGCAMTTFTVFVSGLYYSGWDAVARHDPQVFWRGITTQAEILTPIAALFVGLTAWNAYRGLRLERESRAGAPGTHYIQGSSADGP